jgi:hypothetical protein
MFSECHFKLKTMIEAIKNLEAGVYLLPLDVRPPFMIV